MNTCENKKQSNSSCVPIVIGITGHRDIAKRDESELRTAIRNIFNDLKRNYPNSPLMVLSALAEGADCIAADEAIKSEIPVKATIPMDIEEYEKDFTDETSLLEFRRLLTQCESYYVVSALNVRPYNYRQAGIYIAEHCHILIAFWDGIYHMDKIGGTSEIVKFKLEGNHPSSTEDMYKANNNLLIAPNRGAVYHILTPRKSNIAPVGKDFSLKKLLIDKSYSDCEVEITINRILSNINQYNKDVSCLTSRLSKNIEASMRYVIEDTDKPLLSVVQQKLLNAYATADQLSMHYRNKRLLFLKLLTSAGLALVLFFLLYDELESNIMLPLYILTLMGAYFLNFWANKSEFQNKYVDYRALAEGLKVQFYWNICGIHLNASEHYRFGQLDELAWIRYAITGCLSYHIQAADNIEQEKAFNIANKSWIMGQDDYFRKASQDKSNLLNKHEALVNILFVASIVIILSISFLEFTSVGFMGKTIPVSEALSEFLFMHFKVGITVGDIEYQELFVRSIFKIVLAIIVALIAFISNYNNKLALSEQVKTYIKMGSLFEITRELFGETLRANNYKSGKKILFELGNEALAENASWVLLHRERPLEVPK